MSSFTKYAVALVVVLCSLHACEALTWNDCGMPLQRWVSYESVTLSPSDNIQIGSLLSLNIFAVVSQPILPLDTINTLVTIVKDNQLFMNASTRNLCDMLSANEQECTYREGQKISYTYQFLVPEMPRGNYTIRIYQTSTLIPGAEVGCAQLTTTVEGLTNTGSTDSCNYQSTFDASFTGTLHFSHPSPFDQELGDYIQVGPWGGNAGASASAFDWGLFTSITGSSDIVGAAGAVSNASAYEWGINGTLVEISNGSSPITHVYNGTVVVGYYNANTSILNFVYGGNFQFIFSAVEGSSYDLVVGYIALFSKWYHPVGFTYPLVVGNLDPLTVTGVPIPAPEGNIESGPAPAPLILTTSLSGSKQWCTCGDTCGLGTSFDRSQVAAASSGLSLTASAAIAVAVVGTVALVMATIFFVVHYRSSKRPILDPSEVVYPNKPDYGNLALGEIIDEETGDQRLL